MQIERTMRVPLIYGVLGTTSDGLTSLAILGWLPARLRAKGNLNAALSHFPALCREWSRPPRGTPYSTLLILIV